MIRNSVLVLFLILALFPLEKLISQTTDAVVCEKHLKAIIETDGYRNYKNINTLNTVSEYIFNCFKENADTVYYQDYQVNGNKYRNVVCVFNSKATRTIVIGAHYDVCGNQDGADDNASGVVALLELSRLIKGKSMNYRIEIVAYSLEEPPFFKTQDMGSYIHAKSLYENKRDVYGMICFDMIGYFSEVKGSQTFPLPLLSLFYGSKGNFITIVNKYGKGKFARRFTSSYKRNSVIRAKKFTGPRFIQGIDFSDHLNYWNYGYSAVFITNTAFYRNKSYHTSADKAETLNYVKMAQVIDGVYKTIIKLK